MEPAAVMEALLDLAREAGIEVRSAGPGLGEPGDAPVASDICRLKDRVYVVLAASDPVEAQLELLGRALALHGKEVVEGRFLPPAVRSRVE